MGSGRRKSSHLGDILESEQLIPEEVVLECFIDPFTGQFITNEVAKKECSKSKSSTNKNSSGKKNLKVNVDTKSTETGNNQDDDGIGSLPITPPDFGKNKSLSVSKKPIKCDGDSESIPTDDGIYTSSEETIHQSRSCVSDSDQSLWSLLKIPVI